MTYKPRKGEAVIVFGETTHYQRPMICFKGVVVRRKPSGDYRVRLTHATHDGGVSYRERPPLAKARERDVHRLDVYPGDDVAALADLKRRVADWEAEDPDRLAAWKANEERMRRESQALTRELSKLMRRFL